MAKRSATARRYEFWFQVPRVFDCGLPETRVAKNLALGIVEARDSPLLDVGMSPSNPDFFIRIACGRPAFLEIATAVAVSTLKQFIVLAQRARVLTKADSYCGPITDNGEPMDQASCHVMDLDGGDFDFASVPERLTDYVRLLDFGKDAFVASSRRDGGALTQNKKAAILLSKLRSVSAVLDCPDSVPDAPRIKTALEWEFEAADADDDTVAFVQTCIALEALLGSATQDEPLVARLADRCAYLLGKGETEREEIRKAFRRMYAVRSQLVHGRKAKLGREETEQLSVAKKLLRVVSDREIANLVSSHRSGSLVQ